MNVWLYLMSIGEAALLSLIAAGTLFLAAMATYALFALGVNYNRAKEHFDIAPRVCLHTIVIALGSMLAFLPSLASLIWMPDLSPSGTTTVSALCIALTGCIIYAYLVLGLGRLSCRF